MVSLKFSLDVTQDMLVLSIYWQLKTLMKTRQMHYHQITMADVIAVMGRYGFEIAIIS